MLRLVSGHRNGGKSGYLRELAHLTGATGFLSPKVLGARGHLGYDLLALPGGERRPLVRLSPLGPEWFRFRRFFFDQGAFDWALERARELVARGDGPLILDEFGPLEAERRGFYPVLTLFLETGRKLTVSCRPSLAAYLGEIAPPDRPLRNLDLAP
ncbi:MAG: hypothetical protein ACLFPW_10995 [Spirochaetaceae bacterium]